MRLGLLLLLAACGHAPAELPRATGPVRVEHLEAESDVAFEVDTGVWVPAQRQSWQRTTWDREIEVLASDGDRVTRARVTYRAYRTMWTVSGGGEVGEDGPLAGHSYLVDASAGAGALAITAVDGGAVPASHVARLRTELRGFGAPDAIAAVLHDAPLDVGARFAIGEAVLAQLVGGDAPDEYWGRATVIDHTATRLVLGLEIAQRRLDAADGSQIGNDLTGTLVIDPIARRAVALDLAGRIKVVQRTTRAGHAVDADGAGAARLRWTSSLGR